MKKQGGPDRLPVVYALIGLLAAEVDSACADGAVYARLDVLSSSEPVPVLDMVSGWDGPFEPGRYAFGDVRAVMGVRLDDWFFERESRWHYDLTFSPGMSRYYHSAEQGLDLKNDERLMLSVRSLEATGVRLGKSIQLSSSHWNGWRGEWRIRPALAVYRVGHFQFGHLSGVAEGGGSGQASAELDYRYDDDKILEHDPFVPEGWGVSLDLGVAWQHEQWRAQVMLQDMINRFQLDDAAFTTACINVNAPSDSVCSSTGTASGRSGQDDFIARLRPTLSGRVIRDDWGAELGVQYHGDYQRVSAYRFWALPDGEVGVSAHSTRQLGVHWRSDWVTLDWVADDLRQEYARDIEARLGVQFLW